MFTSDVLHLALSTSYPVCLFPIFLQILFIACMKSGTRAVFPSVIDSVQKSDLKTKMMPES